MQENLYITLPPTFVQQIEKAHGTVYNKYEAIWGKQLGADIITFGELCQIVFDDYILEDYLLDKHKLHLLKTKITNTVNKRKRAWYQAFVKKLDTVDISSWSTYSLQDIKNDFYEWSRDTNTTLASSAIFDKKLIGHQIKAYKLDLAKEMITAIVSNPDCVFYNDAKIEVTRPMFFVTNPIYSPNKSKLNLAKQEGTANLMDVYTYAEGCSIVTLIEDLEAKLSSWPMSKGKKPIDPSQLCCLDLKDAQIVDYICSQINVTQFIDSNGRVDIYLKDIVQAIYGNTSGASYADLRKRLFQLHCYSLKGSGVDFNGKHYRYAVSFFDIVDFEDDNKISLYFSPLLREAFINSVTLSFTPEQKKALERSPANLILHRLHLERIQYGIQDIKNDVINVDGYTKEYSYGCFLNQFRFSHNRRDKQKLAIQTAINDMIEQKYIVKEAQFTRKSAFITFYPLTEQEINNLGVVNTQHTFNIQ